MRVRPRDLAVQILCLCAAELSLFLLSGRASLAITGYAASVSWVQLRTNLVAGNDPLRPSVKVPALPAWLKGITDELGFFSPDLGGFQMQLS